MRSIQADSFICNQQIFGATRHDPVVSCSRSVIGGADAGQAEAAGCGSAWLSVAAAAWYCSMTLTGIRPRALTALPWSFAHTRMSPLRCRPAAVRDERMIGAKASAHSLKCVAEQFVGQQALGHAVQNLGHVDGSVED